ncbi:hypothetical protein QOZ80_5AG0371620 [Eleusine coracana subsp. coracana]|nr:hypothetical protein QOZ80_5AG0371620 [Eleusine coracana subsp. coracana]
MFLAKRPPWLSQISRHCILHTVTWIISWRQLPYCSYSCSSGNATPGTPGRLSELFCPVQIHISGLIVHVLEHGRLSDSVELELDRLRIDLDPFVVNRVLRGLSDSDTAVRFYWWAESRPGFHHTQFAIAYIVSMLFLDGDFALLSEFLERVKSQGLTLHRSLYRILISGYVRAGKFGSVIQTFDEMVMTGCREFGVDYNSSRAIEALDLFRDMRARGVEPDSLTFRYLINGLLEEGKATMAYEVALISLKALPDTWTSIDYCHN